MKKITQEDRDLLNQKYLEEEQQYAKNIKKFYSERASPTEQEEMWHLLACYLDEYGEAAIMNRIEDPRGNFSSKWHEENGGRDWNS